MRLTDRQVAAIRYDVESLCGGDAVVQRFGLRFDDAASGGDVDLLVILPEAIVHPARLSATLSARISRCLFDEMFRDD
ncbi:nucleotidyltransferase domain-containing protein [Spiribacter sp. 218]|uniref:nucleotidyltransferase domain-containing protein n=1 Tax=Spiribacter pallidus TaxID=1987936 RepID=UPI00349F7857